MSLYIDVDHVTEVLLADGWHPVINDSFTIDSYEFQRNDDMVLLRGGQDPLISAGGFGFEESRNVFMAGPLTSVLAVRY